jgi:ubiquitin-protein ligase
MVTNDSILGNFKSNDSETNLQGYTITHKELQQLQSNPLEGIAIIINEENILDIQAWIQGPGIHSFICS